MATFDRPVLITGAAGCIGAWVVAALVRDGSPVVVFDLSDDRRRLRMLLGESEVASLPWYKGDIADPESLQTVFVQNDVSALIHLAALQVPLCKADPVAGARANVVGQINVLEAARRHGVRRLVYTSSVAALPSPGDSHPATLYGTYKAADEAIAQIYWRDWSVSSIGLRPHTVYGLGRDQGLTAAPTNAMLAAVARRRFTIPFSGPVQFQYAADVAEVIVQCAAKRVEGAPVLDLGGPAVLVDDIVAAIRRVDRTARIEISGEPLPFPHDRDGGPLRALLGRVPVTPLDEGVKATLALFHDLLARGLVSPEVT